jgi:hypothetical protein
MPFGPSGGLIYKDFRRFPNGNRANSGEKAEFALVGGWAVAFHGYPRFTGDMDILVNPTPENSAKVIKVLHRFGFGSRRPAVPRICSTWKICSNL